MALFRPYISSIDFYLKGLKGQLEQYKSQFWMKKKLGYLQKLQQIFGSPQLEPWMHPYLVTKINNLEVEFRFLSTFLSYVTIWTDASKVVQNLESLDLRIEAAMAEMKEYLHTAYYKEYIIICPCKLIDLISSLLEKIKVFKSEIREAYYHDNHLSSHSFQSISPLHHYSQWKTFVRSIAKNLQALSQKLVNGDPLRTQIGAIKDLLSSFLCFVEDECPDRAQPDSRIEDLFIRVGDVAIHAAHLSCLCWFKEEIDFRISKEIAVILSDFRPKIDPTTPEFLEANLQFLEAMKNQRGHLGSEHLADRFVKYLLGGRRLDVLYEELKFLVSTATNSEGQLSGEGVHSVLADIKAAIVQVGVLKCTLDREMGTDLVLCALLEKVWLIRVELFLMKQSHGDPDHILERYYQYRALDERLSLLRTYFKGLPQAMGEKEDDQPMLPFLEEVNRSVMSLYHSLRDKEVTKSRARDVFYMLLLKILLFKAESSIVALLRNNAGLLDLVKDRIRALHEELRFLTILVTHQLEENTEKDKLIFIRIFSVSKGVISLNNSFLENIITKEMVFKMNLLLSDLLAEVNLVKADLKKIYIQILRHNFPKTNPLGFIDFLLRKLREMLKYNPNSIASVKHQCETILEDLELFKYFLRDVVEKDIENQELKDLGTHVINVAYVAEYVIDSIMAGGTWYDFSAFYCLLEEIRLLKIQTTEIYHKKTTDIVVQNFAHASKNEISQASTLQVDGIAVNLHDQEEAIIVRLMRGSLQRDLVAIVGMPGIGKTTMAKKVFNDPKVTYHFHIRAWCRVSQVYIKRDLLLEILNYISGPTADTLQLADADLELQLYQSLKRKRYLIVLDDMWNTGALDELERSLPNDENGSRILMTSRLHDVALKAKPDSKPHPLRLLSDDESWNLLQSKVFHKDGCPEELLEIGKQICKSCGGLPLAIVAIAGLLERTDRTKDWWKQILESLSSHIVDDPGLQCKVILELSYMHLPDHLKACFLYFGTFLEDKDIPVRRLIWLWIGEGFVQKRQQKSLEDLAEEYLMDLIGRSLVMVAKRRSNGRVKACRLHDILRGLCQSKSKEDNFYRIITRYEQPHASYGDRDYGMDFDYIYHSDSITYDDHRLCIFTKRNHFVMSRPTGAHVRSLLFFATSDMYPRCPYDVSFISHNFKLLQVLDVECINMGPSFISGIELLVHLRYLAVSGDIDSVPSSISQLWNLETFILKGLKGKVVLPDTVWYMVRLRHVYVNNHATFTLLDGNLEKVSQLVNLVSLSSISLPIGDDVQMIIRRFPNLRMLRCIIWEPKKILENCDHFPRLDFLTQLESLKISYYGTAPNSSEFTLPLSLKELTLSNFRFQWEHISAIGRLPNLEVLKLLGRAFEGEIWEMREGEFLSLKFLKLDTLNIVQWCASSDHLPILQHLQLENLKQLEEVPPAFLEISTLQAIEVNGCGHSADDLFTRIEEEGIEGLTVIVNGAYSNFK